MTITGLNRRQCGCESPELPCQVVGVNVGKSGSVNVQVGSVLRRNYSKKLIVLRLSTRALLLQP